MDLLLVVSLILLALGLACVLLVNPRDGQQRKARNFVGGLLIVVGTILLILYAAGIFDANTTEALLLP